MAQQIAAEILTVPLCEARPSLLLGCRFYRSLGSVVQFNLIAILGDRAALFFTFEKIFSKRGSFSLHHTLVAQTAPPSTRVIFRDPYFREIRVDRGR